MSTPRAAWRCHVRRVLGAFVMMHGLIHVLGVVKGFGWAHVAQLSEPVGVGVAFGWLAAAVLVTGAGLLLVIGVRWWWAVGLVAAVVSQLVIVTSWRDARMGTVANVVLAFAALHGLAAEGPLGLRAGYRRSALRAVADAPSVAPGVITIADLARLPGPVAAYVVASGAVGQPHVAGFVARIRGRIRGGPDEPWMTFVGEQTNTFGSAPRRLFCMDATRGGILIDVFHSYVGPSARMRVRAMSIAPMVDASGSMLTRAETVTLFNDLCVFAPGALVDVPVEWSAIDAHRVGATYTNAGHTVRAELVFAENDQLVDFVSDDRQQAAPDGASFAPRRWSTPVGDVHDFHGHRVVSEGRARWQDPGTDGFDYLELHVDDVRYLEGQGRAATGGHPDALALVR